MPSFIEFKELEGRTLKDVINHNHCMEFVFTEGPRVVQFHVQQCCEQVWLEDIDGDISRLIGQTIIQAEERDATTNKYKAYFYTIRTNLDSVTLRWFGDGGDSGWYAAEAWTYELGENESAVDVSLNNAGM